MPNGGSQRPMVIVTGPCAATCRSSAASTSDERDEAGKGDAGLKREALADGDEQRAHDDAEHHRRDDEPVGERRRLHHQGLRKVHELCRRLRPCQYPSGGTGGFSGSAMRISSVSSVSSSW